MRKRLAVTVVAVIGVLGATVAIATASTTLVTPKSLTAGASPKHIKSAPYKFNLKGKLTLPEICPAGVTAPSPYCTTTPASFCSGKVTVVVSFYNNGIVKDSGDTLKKYTAKLASDCTYSGTVTLKKSLFKLLPSAPVKKLKKYIGVKFSPEFSGNSFVNEFSGKTQTVLAKVHA